MILAFSLSSVLQSISLVLSFNCSQNIIKGDCNQGVRLPDVKDDVVTEIFFHPTLGSPAHVVGCRVLLLDIGSFISHPLNPGQHYLHQALYVDLHVESEAMWEDGGITSPSLVNSPNTMMCIGGLVFITICTSCGVNSSSDPGRNFSHLRKDKACLVGWDA